MSEERERVRCRNCDLVQWRSQANCRRCGIPLPEPIIKVVERVVEKVVIRQDPQCLRKLEQAYGLISAATGRLQPSDAEERVPTRFSEISEAAAFPTMAELKRAMIVAAYERSNHKPLEAARLLGIGKTTVYRKLKEMGHAAT